MNPKRTKAKEQRLARNLAEEAWQAVQSEQLDLAEKIIRRATAIRPDNPVLWNDQGMILALCQKEGEAEQAFYSALSLTPNFAEPYHHLAALAMQRGWLEKALSLESRAADLDPDIATYRDRMELYRSLIDASVDKTGIDPPASVTQGRDAVSLTELASTSSIVEDLVERLRDLDWYQLGQRLTREGCVLIGQLIEPSVCRHLCGLFDHDALFAKTVVMDQPTFGQGVYRYFKAPVPELVDGFRHAVYPYAARIVNQWQRLLGDDAYYPETWNDFRDQCHAAGQKSPTAILLKYESGGFNALHRDLRGDIFFPIQLAVVLSPRRNGAGSEGFEGGDFLFCDVPETQKSTRRAITAGLGDAMLFCTRDRIVRVGQMVGLQPVKHGVTPITGGVRYVLGLPFHEYRGK